MLCLRDLDSICIYDLNLNKICHCTCVCVDRSTMPSLICTGATCKTVLAICSCTYICAFMAEHLDPAQSLPHLVFVCLQESKFSVSCPTSLGKVVLIEVDKKPLPLFPEDAWFPCKVKVKSPEGDIYNFPIYRWISDREVSIFREGTGL